MVLDLNSLDYGDISSSYHVSQVTDELQLITTAMVRYFIQTQHQKISFENSRLSSCSSASSPCPEGCQEITDCKNTILSSCGGLISLYQYPKSQAITQFGCSCTCQMADSSSTDQVIVRDAIMDMYNSLGGDGWYVSTNWHNPSYSVCSYGGVYCNANNNIIAIGMIDNNVIGSIPSSLSSIQPLQSSLGFVWFSNNLISGTLPSTFSKLNALYSLTVPNNALEGRIRSNI